MRELVYLSEPKLRAFTPTRRSRLRRLGVDLELRLPGMGGAAVRRPSDGTGDGPDLERVLVDLESSRRAARWFADPGVRAGDWVQFEAPMNVHTFEEDYLHGAVLFADVARSGQPRLLLHGSAEHVRGHRPATLRTSPDEQLARLPVPSVAPSTGEFVYRLAEHRYVLGADGPRAALGGISRSLAEAERDDGTVGEENEFRARRLADRLRLLLAVLDGAFDPATAARLTGLARVTGQFPAVRWANPRALDLPALVVATPLFVEYATED